MPPCLPFSPSAVRAADPVLVGHRGLPTHVPEETRAAFNACIDLRLGVELGVRRRFIPSIEQVKGIHEAGKRIFLVGPLVAGKESANWARCRAAGVDTSLTDHPLGCRSGWRENP